MMKLLFHFEVYVFPLPEETQPVEWLKRLFGRTVCGLKNFMEIFLSVISRKEDTEYRRKQFLFAENWL